MAAWCRTAWLHGYSYQCMRSLDCILAPADDLDLLGSENVPGVAFQTVAVPSKRSIKADS